MNVLNKKLQRLKKFTPSCDDGLLSSSDDDFELPLPALIKEDNLAFGKYNDLKDINKKLKYFDSLMRTRINKSRLERDHSNSESYFISSKNKNIKLTEDELYKVVDLGDPEKMNNEKLDKFKVGKTKKLKINELTLLSHLTPNRSLMNFKEKNILLLKNELF